MFRFQCSQLFVPLLTIRTKINGFTGQWVLPLTYIVNGPTCSGFYSKGFSRNLLARNLASYELTVGVLRIVISYFCDKQYFVSYRRVTSASLWSGMDLGMVLGPFLPVVFTISWNFTVHNQLLLFYDGQLATNIHSLQRNWSISHQKLPPICER